MKNIKKNIVITSIFEPTEAVEKFSKAPGFKTIVVGDKKTPDNWSLENVDYLSVEKQKELGFKLTKYLPYNHYSRKMVGYLKSISDGANYIVDTDDDNIPKETWRFPEFEGEYEVLVGDEGFVNVYQLFTEQRIWPRGLPIDLISKNFTLEENLKNKDCKVGVWQGLADEDPDVDAIYRLTNDAPCNFNPRKPVVLSKGIVSPFNTQNTIFRKELFPLMYLPTYVTFRFTDILRGLVAQPIMWLYGYNLGFTEATVIQKRNPHEYMKDFISEIPMYQHSRKVVEVVESVITGSEGIEDNLYRAYAGLLKEGIVCEKELEVLEAWLKDLERLL